MHGGGACRLTFNATGHPQGVVLSRADVTESFADRPLRTATSLASAWYAEDFTREFSDERNFTAPNLAVMGWTKKQPTYVAAYATRVQWDAGRRELSYDLEQSPEQAGTQSLGGRRAAQAAREGGSAKLRKCAIFVDGGHGCTCGDYTTGLQYDKWTGEMFWGLACCKCDPPGSSTPSTHDNPVGCRLSALPGQN